MIAATSSVNGGAGQFRHGRPKPPRESGQDRGRTDWILVGPAYLQATMTLSWISLRPVFIVVTSFCLGSGALRAQEPTPTPVPFPQTSQHAVIKQRVGLTDFEVDYSRPNKNKRDIFGGLVAFDKVWRTGANGATKIKFNSAVTFGDKEIAPGEYGLFTIPKTN